MNDLTPEDRQYLLARLAGFLHAAAAIDGTFRDCAITVDLVARHGRNVPAIAADWLAESEARRFRLNGVSEPQRWSAVEGFLRDLLLAEPFGIPRGQQPEEVAAARRELAWQAADLVMFLSPDHDPGDFHLLEVEEDKASSIAACAVCYEEDVLFIRHIRWRREAAGMSPGSPTAA